MNENQIRRLWKKKTTRLWSDLRQRYALPVPIPDEVRDTVERDFAEDVAEVIRAGAGEGELDELLTDYRERAEQELQKLVRELVAFVQALPRKGLPGSGAEGRGSRPKGCEEFRLRHRRRVLEFVALREVPLRHLLGGSFNTGGRPTSWQRLAREWKRTYPRDALPPETLRRYYHRARTDPRVCRPFLGELHRRWTEWADRMSATLKTLESAGWSEADVFVRFTEPRPLHPDLAKIWKMPAGTLLRSAVISAKPRPEVARALSAAARGKCVWTALDFALPRDFEFCRRRDCRGCRVFRSLRKAGLLEISPQVLKDPERLSRCRDQEIRRFRKRFAPGSST